MNELHRNYVGGCWIDGLAVPNINPSDTDDVVGQYAHGSAADMQLAVAAAKDAFAGWSRTGIQRRHDILKAVSDEILARRYELGALLAREEGKPVADGVAETIRAGQIFDFFAGETLRLAGQSIASVRPGIEVTMTREPVGVVGVITPWNFPLAIPSWKIAPALAYGNTVVFKPAELTPACAWALVDILARAGLPEGVVNLVMGQGAVVGDALLRSADVDAITFTGSIGTGKTVAALCVQHLRKFQLEMGGKNPLVILDDADLNLAVEAAANGAYFQTGQRCTASSKLLVAASVHDEFVAKLTQRMSALVVDHALKEGTQIGPVVDARQMASNERYLRIGLEEGAQLHWGGARLTRDTPGCYLQPALFTQTHAGMRINREEIFGPVASVIRVRDYEEALALANDTPFGLVAGICTTSLKYATHFKRNVEAGMVMVNLPTAGVDYHVAFGGRKQSSFGPREQGHYAAEFFTTVKTTYAFS